MKKLILMTVLALASSGTWAINNENLRIERLKDASERDKAKAYYTAETIVCSGVFRYLSDQTNDEQLKKNASVMAERIWGVAHLSLSRSKLKGQQRNMNNVAFISPLLIDPRNRLTRYSWLVEDIVGDLKEETYTLLSGTGITQECLETVYDGGVRADDQIKFSKARLKIWENWVEEGGKPPKTVLPKLFEVEPFILERYPQLDFQSAP